MALRRRLSHFLPPLLAVLAVLILVRPTPAQEEPAATGEQAAATEAQAEAGIATCSTLPVAGPSPRLPCRRLSGASGYLHRQ